MATKEGRRRWWRPERGGMALAVVLAAVVGLGAQTPQAQTAHSSPKTQSQQAPKPPTIVTGVTVVDVPVIALNREGEAVPALPRDDFRLLDDGQPQRLSAFDSAQRPVSLAVVVDTRQWAALAQAQRAAQVISQMLVGRGGRAAVFIPGDMPKEVSNFRHGAQTLVATLHRLKLGPTRTSLDDTLELALLRLRQQPASRTRAVLVITQSAARVGPTGREVVESAMENAIPIFRVYAPIPRGPAPETPLNPETNGTGAGSQSEQPVPPVGDRGNPTPPADDTMNLGALIFPVVQAIGSELRSGQWNYVHATGGLDLHARNDRQFDQRLGEVGNALRAIYHLYYIPNDLGSVLAIHHIEVRMTPLAPAQKAVFRRSYLGYQP